jgi:hypothetical protein
MIILLKNSVHKVVKVLNMLKLLLKREILSKLKPHKKLRRMIIIKVLIIIIDLTLIYFNLRN